MPTRLSGVVLIWLLLASFTFAQDAIQPLSGDFKASVASLSLHSGMVSDLRSHAGSSVSLSDLDPQAGSSSSLTPPPPPRGANTPAFEAALGYVYTSFNSPRASHNMNGGIASITGNLSRWLGFTAEVTGSAIGGLPAATDGTLYTYLFGPHFARRSDRVTPFLHGLFGGARLNVNAPPTVAPGSFLVSTQHENAFAMALGGGFDVNLGKRLSWRLVEADYLFTNFTDGQTNRQNSFRASTAIIAKFKVGPPPPPPNHPPTVSLTANPTQVVSGDSAVLQAQGNDPDNDPLTYVWSATAGKIDGTGAEVRWGSADVAPGHYTVTVKADDGRGGIATASTDVSVVPRPDRPPTVSVCAANPATVTAGQPVNITTAASDPDNDPLTYSYSSTGGSVSGSGPQAQLATAGLAPGRYTVTCHVDDGKGGIAEASAEFEVQSPPTPPQQKQLEMRLSLHSIYFPTAQPTAHNPTGGLLFSQQRTLITLANDCPVFLSFFCG